MIDTEQRLYHQPALIHNSWKISHESAEPSLQQNGDKIEQLGSDLLQNQSIVGLPYQVTKTDGSIEYGFAVYSTPYVVGDIRITPELNLKKLCDGDSECIDDIAHRSDAPIFNERGDFVSKNGSINNLRPDFKLSHEFILDFPLTPCILPVNMGKMCTPWTTNAYGTSEQSLPNLLTSIENSTVNVTLPKKNEFAGNLVNVGMILIGLAVLGRMVGIVSNALLRRAEQTVHSANEKARQTRENTRQGIQNAKKAAKDAADKAKGLLSKVKFW